MRKLFYLFSGISIVASIVYTSWMFFSQQQTMPTFGSQNPNAVQYIALGDSYTVGQNVPSKDSWPAQLVAAAKTQGVDMRLIGVAATSGWTTQDLIEKGLPTFDAAQPQFATLMIGTNDVVQGKSPEQFKSNLQLILDHLAEQLPPEKIVMMTIPDYLVTPTGAQYARGDQPEQGILEFNSIIQQEGASRGIAVVDLFELSQGMANDSSLISGDGLHPSAAEYKLWVQKILPTVLTLLPKNTTP